MKNVAKKKKTATTTKPKRSTVLQNPDRTVILLCWELDELRKDAARRHAKAENAVFGHTEKVMLASRSSLERILTDLCKVEKRDEAWSENLSVICGMVANLNLRIDAMRVVAADSGLANARSYAR